MMSSMFEAFGLLKHKLDIIVLLIIKDPIQWNPLYIILMRDINSLKSQQSISLVLHSEMASRIFMAIKEMK